MQILSLLCYVVAALALTPAAAFNPAALRQQTRVGYEEGALIRQRKTSRLNAATPTDTDLKRFQSYGESSRKFRRSYFTHSDWLKSRADDRFLSSLTSIVKSGIVRQLGKEISFVAGSAFFICVWNVFSVGGYDDFQGIHQAVENGLPTLQLPKEPFSLSSPSLALLLVFRTNTAFKRWDEGRKAWGAIINSCRTCLRTGTTWADKEAGGTKENLELLADAVWSFPRSLQFHMLGPLEDGADYARDLQNLKNKKFARSLLAVRHKPTRSLKEITSVLAATSFKSVVYQIETEKAVTVLCDSLGACERIFTSPPPVFYSRHTARFLVCWVFLLPFALYPAFADTWNHCGMIPASLVIAYFLLGIEELAAQMEEPFSILPMDKMTGGIRLSVDEHVNWKKFAQQAATHEQTATYEQFAEETNVVSNDANLSFYDFIQQNK
jgi:putative membrane protein